MKHRHGQWRKRDPRHLIGRCNPPPVAARMLPAFCSRGLLIMKITTVGQRVTPEIAPHPGGVGSRAEHRFYVGAALLMIFLSIAGFGPSILDQSRRNAPSSPMVIAHGMVVGAWLLLFLIQAALV